MFDLCYNLPTEVVKTLPMKYRRILFSERATKGFCEKSTVDEKLLFFHYIGLTNSLTVFPETIKGKNQVKEFFKNIDEEKLGAAQKGQAVLNIYCSTDKETSHLMGMMASTISSKGYLINLDYNKTAYHLKGWDKKLNYSDAELFNETEDSAELIAKTILNTINSFDTSDLLHEVSGNHIRVLIFMFLRRSKYLSKELFFEYFITSMSKKKITGYIKQLLMNGFIQKHVDIKHPRYTINSKGINLVYDFMKRILKLNNF